MNLVVIVAVALATPAMPSSPERELLTALVPDLDPTPHFSLLSAEKEAELRALLPQVDDPMVAAMLNDSRLLLYTEEEMPRAYQFWDGMLQGVHRADYNISANDSEPFGNGNIEFPWGSPAGTHRTENVTTFRFLWLPRGADGKRLPVVWYRRHLTGDGRMGYAWTYPQGAVVGEVLCLNGPDGNRYAFEMRLRRREVNDWGVDVFRPFRTAEELAARVKELRPEWDAQANLVTLCDHLTRSIEMEPMKLIDQQPGTTAFEQRMGIDSLPPVEDDALVMDLLKQTTFRSSLGATWRFGTDGLRTAAPTTEAPFHIVPANYDAGFVDVDRVSCVRCHETVNQNVRRFNSGRDWYGRIRGSDGIFSFHPFAPESISDNGYGRTVRMRKDMEQAGVIATYDPAKHPVSHYTTIEYLGE